MYLPILMLYWEFTSSPNFQTNCVNDFSPLIAALATLLTVQAPVLVGLVVNQIRMRNEIAHNTRLTYNLGVTPKNPNLGQTPASDYPARDQFGPGNANLGDQGGKPPDKGSLT